MRSRSHGRTALVGVFVMAVLASVAGSAQAEETGTISGRFTNDGVGIANVLVWASSPAQAGFATTDANGDYQITGLAPDSYRVSFRPTIGLAQFAHGTTQWHLATEFAVTAGAVTSVSDEQLEFATIRGRFLDRQGAGMEGAQVAFWPAGQNGSYTQTNAPGGVFSAAVVPGTYRIAFNLFNELPAAPYIQYAGGTDVMSQGTVFHAQAGATVDVEETILPTGRMTGRLTDGAGNGLSNVEVSISRDDLDRGVSASTDANGDFNFPRLRAIGGYRVAFNAHLYSFHQYAFGKVEQAQADLITIREGETTSVNDSRLPTGTVRVTARDAVSGVAVETFQAGIGIYNYAETFDGAAVISDVAAGTHQMSVSAHGYADPGTVPVTVTAGRQTDIEVLLRPRSRVETRVVDAATGAPVAGVCLLAVKPLQARLVSERCDVYSSSSSSGRIMATVDTPGWYQMLVLPDPESQYGIQWLGATGGTGSQLAAQLVQVQEGGSALAPVIKLDRSGSVAGNVTDPGGSPAPFASVAVLPLSPFEGGPDVGATQADEAGNYTLTNLGPYQWPLLYGGSQWSGAVGNRHLAQHLTVRTGQTTANNFRFREPVQLKLNVTGVARDCYVYVHNAVTGDRMGFQWAEQCAQPIQTPVVGPQVVKLRLAFQNDAGEWVERWYGPNTFLTAKPVILPSHGSKSVTIAF